MGSLGRLGAPPSPPAAPSANCCKPINIFPTPLLNDFQWRNLYLREYGVCTYAPPLQRDPSTTTSAFPKRADIGRDGEEDYAMVKTGPNGERSREASFFNIAGDDGHGDGADGADPSKRLPALHGAGMSKSGSGGSSIHGARGNSETKPFSDGGGDGRTLQTPSEAPFSSPAAEEDGDALLNSVFFDFLQCGGSGGAAGGTSLSPSGGNATARVLASSGGWSEYGPAAEMPLSAYGQSRANPHGIPAEVFTLHKETWTLLMDNRAMAWLEREAKEKGHTAAQVRRRLLEVISNPQHISTVASSTPPRVSWRRATGSTCTRHDGSDSAGGADDARGTALLLASSRKSLGGRSVALSADSKHLAEADAAGTLPEGEAAAAPVVAPFSAQPEAALITEETAQQRLYEAFQPFFAVISPPSILRRLRDQFNASRRAQMRGMRGAAANVVGFPLFSQFATWREAYEHRRTWNATPFSFFLVHDASYNFAQVSALFVLLEKTAAMTHKHNLAKCLAGNETVMLEDATDLLTRSRNIRETAEAQRCLCPLFAIQQMAENVLLVFEQSSSRTTLTMALHVLAFLTDLALDPETAARFLSPDALCRQSAFVIPGMNVAPHATQRQQSPSSPRSPSCQTQGKGTDSPSEDTDDDKKDGDGGGGGSEEEPLGAGGRAASQPARRNVTAGAAATTAEKGSEQPADHLLTAAALAPKRFSDADFEALFDLSLWFLDAATANSRLPIDPSLLPARSARAMAHPEQQSPSPSVTPETSMSIGSNQSTPVGRAGSASQRHLSLRKSASRQLVGQRRPDSVSGRSLGGASSVQSGGSGSVGSVGSVAAAATGLDQHLYIPGRHQLHQPVGSLADAMILHEVGRQRLRALREEEEAAAARHRATRTPASGLDDAATGTQLSRRRRSSRLSAAAVSSVEGSAGRGRRVSLQRKQSTPRRPRTRSSAAQGNRVPLNLSPSTTLLSTPLLFITSYVRLHGATWLRSLFSRLFNILRRESVLLYVNRLDLEGPQQARPGDEGGSRGSQSPPRSPGRHRRRSNSLHSMTRTRSMLSLSMLGPHLAASGSSRDAASLGGRLRQNSVSAQSAATSTRSAVPVARAAAATSPRATPPPLPPIDAAHLLELNEAFVARMERLEDLVCQDILYVLNEFFSALHGKRSATRLPQGITSLLTQFTASLHLHLLGNVILTSEVAAEGPGGMARKVAESLARLKQKRMTGKALHTEHVSDRSVERLIRSIEQYRLAKFILFDCWIIPTLNNAVAMGYLSEGSSMHLRWNIDAFARYLKILVNAPFLDEPQARHGVDASAAASSLSANSGAARRSSVGAKGDGAASLSTAAGARQHPPSRKKRKAKEGAASTAAPMTLSLPRYITGIYDVSSGSLVHVSSQVAASPVQDSVDSPPVLHDQSAAANDKSQTMIPEGRAERRGPSRVQRSALRRPSPQPASGKSDKQPRAIYTVMDTSSWEGISSAMKSLNEALGIVGYDPEDLADVLGAGATRSSRGTRSIVNDGFMGGAGFGDNHSAMHVLDMFCHRASVESSLNVVVSEFEVLPTMAAGCIDKIHEMVTGQHPLVEQAVATGRLPSAFPFSPYLACLHGVLLHPKYAARALDNVYHNANRFYQALMRPVQDEGLVSLVSSLVVDQDDLPVVDSNALMPLLASVQPAAEKKASRQTGGRRVPRSTAYQGGTAAGDRSLASLPTTATTTTTLAGNAGISFLSLRSQPLMPLANHAETISLHDKWEAEARRLKRQRHFLATGATQSGGGAPSMVQVALDRVGPPDPYRILQFGSELIQQEARVVPTCFDPWWRAMALALCVKAMSVLEECSQTRSQAFDRWCAEKTGLAARDNRHQREGFINRKGRPPEDATSEDGRTRRHSFSTSVDRGGTTTSAHGVAGAAPMGVANRTSGNVKKRRAAPAKRPKKAQSAAATA